MGTGRLQDCPREKTDFQVVTENGVCEQKSCDENYCPYHPSQHKGKEGEKSKK